MTLYFITGNVNKFNEAKAILGDIEQLDIDLPELQDIDSKKIIKEKLQEALKHKQGDFIVDDTSLHLDCMNGLPGPLIKWFLETIGGVGLSNLAMKLENDKAQARCMIGYAKDGELHFFEGCVEGKIVHNRGDSRFGWDPIFLPDGHSKTYAEMTKEEKNSISHRKIALEKLKEFIQTTS